jgi:hypothetical protein
VIHVEKGASYGVEVQALLCLIVGRALPLLDPPLLHGYIGLEHVDVDVSCRGRHGKPQRKNNFNSSAKSLNKKIKYQFQKR